MNGDEDWMELGESGLVPLKDGWYLEKATGNRVDPSGRVYNPVGEIIHDPSNTDGS